MTFEHVASLVRYIRNGKNLPKEVDARLEAASEALENGPTINVILELRGALYDYAGGDDLMIDLANAYIAALDLGDKYA